jgi:predicted metal-dependent HD superfamily phosphohydrolase
MANLFDIPDSSYSLATYNKEIHQASLHAIRDKLGFSKSTGFAVSTLNRLVERAESWESRSLPTRIISPDGKKVAAFLQYDSKGHETVAVTGKTQEVNVEIFDKLASGEEHKQQHSSQISSVRSMFENWLISAGLERQGRLGKRVVEGYDRNVFGLKFLMSTMEVFSEVKDVLDDPDVVEFGLWFYRMKPTFEASCQVMTSLIDKLDIAEKYLQAVKYVEQRGNIKEGDGAYFHDLTKATLCSDWNEGHMAALDNFASPEVVLKGLRDTVRESLDLTLGGKQGIFLTQHFIERYEAKAYGQLHRKIRELELKGIEMPNI